jgi:quinoprotein dehydrogenase-associated probable ABC transporter substrate-binding protein
VAVFTAAAVTAVVAQQAQIVPRTAAAAPRTLRVCADPNNLPYSNDQQQGFENRIADLIAGDLNMPVEYFWLRQGEKFFRKTLNNNVCDVVMGVPAGFDEAATTRAYYRSTYVFITRKSSGLDITSLDDRRLRTLRIGVHILGDSNDNLPPVNALISRGIVKNLVGYSIFGNLNEKDPPADVIRAVEDGHVDVAVVWGPLGGYFSRHSKMPLVLTPLADDKLHPELPFHFDIAIGVRQGDRRLKELMDRELERCKPRIDEILRTYGVPQVAFPAEKARSADSARVEGRTE